MSTPTTIFLIGATGYIGGTVLSQLLSSSSSSSPSSPNSYKITALIRKESQHKAVLLESMGVDTVIGSLSDLEVLEEQSRRNDVVIHCADADYLPAVEAIVRGLRKGGGRSGGGKKIYIHTSGTGVLADDARGEFAYDTVWDDGDLAQVNSLPDTALHRNVDLAVLEASDDIDAHIILPSTIYGIADHELVKKGVSNPMSIQVPALIRASIDRRQAGMVGKGKNLWPDVHVEEVSQIYILLLNSLLSSPSTRFTPASTRQGSYFFSESGEHSLYEVGLAIGQSLSSKGIGSEEPTTFTDDEIKKYFGGSYYLGSNSRAKASRARDLLGWKPKMGKEDFLKSVEGEVGVIIKEDPEGWGFGGRL